MMALHSAFPAADSLSETRGTVDTRWTRTYARQLPPALLVQKCCDGDLIGTGSEEFRRIGAAGWIDEPQIPEHGGNRLARDRTTH